MEQYHDYYWSSIALVVGVPAMGDFLFGFDIGVTSYAVILWQGIGMTPVWIGILVAGTSMGAFGTSLLVVFPWADRMGRRRELQLAATLYGFGAVLETLSWVTIQSHTQTYYNNHDDQLHDTNDDDDDHMTNISIGLLLLGRWTYGAAVAFGLHGATTYVGEIAPASIRGTIMSLNEVSVVTGMLFGYLVGYASPVEAGWAPLYGSSLVVSVPMAWLSLTYLHDSPRWLCWKGRSDEALQSLLFVYQPEAATELHQEILATQPSPHQPSTQSCSLLLQYKPALIAGLGIVALLQLTGQPTVLTYASALLQEAGLSASSAVLVAFFKIAVTLLVVCTVEHQGRKKLLFVGCSLMLMALIVLSIAFPTSRSQSDHTLNSTIILGAMFVYIGGYQIGFGTVIWLITLEVFPLTIRGPAIALSVQTNFALHALVEFLVPILQTWFGLRLVFGLFAIATASAMVFVHMHIPETKGLSLEQLEQHGPAWHDEEHMRDDDDDELHPITNNTTTMLASSLD